MQYMYIHVHVRCMMDYTLHVLYTTCTCICMFTQVTPGGKASKGGVKAGDFVVAINGDSTEGLLHFDAQQMVKATGMSLQFKLSRSVCGISVLLRPVYMQNAGGRGQGGSLHYILV